MSEPESKIIRPRSVGAMLSSAREELEIPVERAAKETRIRVQRLRDIENDDFSNFANPSYARMFLIAYAKYLGVSVNKLHEFLPEPGESGSDGYAYLQAGSDGLPSLRPNLASRRPPSALPKVIILVVVLVLAALGVLTVYLVKNLPRLTSVEQALNEPPPTPEPIVLEPVVLENLPSDGEGSEAVESGFEGEIDFVDGTGGGPDEATISLIEDVEAEPESTPVSAEDERFLEQLREESGGSGRSGADAEPEEGEEVTE